jgi:Glycoside hydrolase family 44
VLDSRAQYSSGPDSRRRSVRCLAVNILFVCLWGCGGGSGTSATTPPPSGVTPPVMPTSLVATAGDQQVALQWSSSATATGYELQRGTSKTGPFASIAKPSGLTFVDSGLQNGTTYFYAVSALNAGGSSAYTAPVSATPSAPPVGAAVTITIDPAATRTISPFIYGVNVDALSNPADALKPVFTINRIGGNRWTAYNWQNNYSNAGSDYFYQNDQYLDSSTVPGHAVTSRIAADRSSGRATIMTVPMLGYVAGDAAGPVNANGTSVDTSRFRRLQFEKGTAFTVNPSNANPSVYADEFVWFVDQAFPGANIFGASPTTVPVLLELDNEPDDWAVTHKEIETSTLIGYDAFFAKSVALATAIKKQFPNARIWGPANAVFSSLFWWDGSYPQPSVTAPPFNWWADGYLAAFKKASDSYGSPLLDAFSMHWYSQITDPSSGAGIASGTSGSVLTDATVQAIVQSPRSLWDPTFVENSWITQDVGGLNGPGAPNAIQIIPRMLAKLANSGMTNKLAFTEYFNGGNNHIAGLLAQAENLGAFGAYGLHAANLWTIGAAPYPIGAFTAYRNFDGGGSNFGDVSVKASSSDPSKVTAYVSRDSSTPNRVVIVAINRDVATQTTGFTGISVTGSARIYRISASTAAVQSTIGPVSVGTQAVTGQSFQVDLPALSVTTIDIH